MSSSTDPIVYHHDKTTVEMTPGGTEQIIAWAESQRLDANRISANGFTITKAADGTLTAHYLEFDLDEHGKLIVNEADEVPTTRKHAVVSCVPFEQEGQA